MSASGPRTARCWSRTSSRASRSATRGPTRPRLPPPAARSSALPEAFPPTAPRSTSRGASGQRLAQLDDLGAHVVDGWAHVLEPAGTQLGLDHARPFECRLPDLGALPGADRLDQLLVLEEGSGLILQTEPRLELARRDRPKEAATADGLGQVMDTGAAGQHPETGRGRRLAMRARDSALEPDHRSGALAADQDALSPTLAQDAVEAVGAPDRREIEHAAAAGVDRVLAEQGLAQVDRVLTEPEERDRLGKAIALGEGPSKPHDLILGIAARRRQQADARPGGIGEVDDQVADRIIADAAIEVVTAQGEDAPAS